MSARVVSAVMKAFGGIVPAWLMAGFDPSVRDGRLTLECASCRAQLAFDVDRELGISEQMRLQNHKTLHDLKLDPLAVCDQVIAARTKVTGAAELEQFADRATEAIEATRLYLLAEQDGEAGGTQ